MIFDTCLLFNEVVSETTDVTTTEVSTGNSNVIYNLTAPGPIFSTLVITAFLVIAFINIFFFLKKVDPLKKTPMWLVPMMWLVDLINGLVKENIGKRWKAYAPWFLTIAVFLFFSNISAIFLLDNPTSYLVVTFTLAMTSFVIIQGSGIISKGFFGWLKGFCDPIPVMLPMNIVSELAFPISLALRLFGNITSGAVISGLIKGALGYYSIIVMPFINILFDLAFGVIQVVVFVMLSVVNTSQKIDDSEKIY